MDSNESYVPDVDDIQHSLHSSSFEVSETELEEATPAASSSGDCRTGDSVQGSSQETENAVTCKEARYLSGIFKFSKEVPTLLIQDIVF